MMGELKELDTKIKSEKLTITAMQHYIESTDTALEMQGDNLERAKKLIENFKKTASDQHRLEIETINIKEYYQKVVSTLRSLLKPQQVKLSIVAEDNMLIRTYPGIHAQIITNLVSNSIRHGFSDEPGNQHSENTITIRVNQKIPEKIEVHYYDNGKGLTKDAADHVFEAFFTTARDKGGIGLGMAIISKLIVEKLNGDISVDANSDGAHFIYCFENIA
jgi:signal transduction histidine kinase